MSKTEITQYGFKMGPLTVERLFSDAKLGSWIRVFGTKETVDIRVTNGGRLRIGTKEKTKS